MGHKMCDSLTELEMAVNTSVAFATKKTNLDLDLVITARAEIMMTDNHINIMTYYLISYPILSLIKIESISKPKF